MWIRVKISIEPNAKPSILLMAELAFWENPVSIWTRASGGAGIASKSSQERRGEHEKMERRRYVREFKIQEGIRAK